MEKNEEVVSVGLPVTEFGAVVDVDVNNNSFRYENLDFGNTTYEFPNLKVKNLNGVDFDNLVERVKYLEKITNHLQV